MEFMKRFDPMWVLLLVLAGLNYAVAALFDKNMVSEIFGTGSGQDIVYCVFGFAALMMVPKMLEGMHMPHYHRPHGA